ncbi:hypothetical protein POTOM_032372 [Populus tomentosa]|uniref:Non-haem dioxygenase N-terminal domain-containing protein n=1 Tax=Populus tomentosa TaxID=118781 RepID=A0A8X7ZEC2_POPTO|nr:hypothetical protein POTOM_032372 [Populus tomentosa]
MWLQLRVVGHFDDVQELRKDRPTTIPERFVRDMTERPAPATVLPSLSTIPTIDFSRLVEGNKDKYKSEMLELTKSVINHGIDLSLLESIEKVAMDFFMLPSGEKQKYPMLPGTFQGHGEAFVFSEDQKLDWVNMIALGLEPHSTEIHRHDTKHESRLISAKWVQKACGNSVAAIMISRMVSARLDAKKKRVGHMHFMDGRRDCFLMIASRFGKESKENRRFCSIDAMDDPVAAFCPDSKSMFASRTFIGYPCNTSSVMNFLVLQAQLNREKSLFSSR